MNGFLRGLLKFALAVALCLLQGCGPAVQSDSGAEADGVAPAVAFELADDPIGRLAEPGPHCFETATEADTARRRAVDAVASENAAQQQRLEQTGKLAEYGRPYSVTDIRPGARGGSCYFVVAHTLATRLGEDGALSGCCAR